MAQGMGRDTGQPIHPKDGNPAVCPGPPWHTGEEVRGNRLLEFMVGTHQITFRMYKSLFPMLKAHGYTFTEVLVLMRLLKHGVSRTTDLAKWTGIPASTFTGVVDRLEKKGMLERVPDPNDRRGVVLKGTAKLHEMAATLRHEWDNKLVDLFAAVPPELLDQANALLGQIYANLAGGNGVDEKKEQKINNDRDGEQV